MAQHPVDVATRAARHAALGDPARLAIVDELLRSDRAPSELSELTSLPSNLLAHHLDVLERVGLVDRQRSSGDGRRRYVHLRSTALDELTVRSALPPRPALFVCTRNSARSQLAAALWRSLTGASADSAGTHPAATVHPGTVRAARRAGIALEPTTPRALTDDDLRAPLVVTVCDQAHEELDPRPGWLHWSITDPVPESSAPAFDRAVAELRQRIRAVLPPRPDPDAEQP